MVSNDTIICKTGKKVSWKNFTHQPWLVLSWECSSGVMEIIQLPKNGSRDLVVIHLTLQKPEYISELSLLSTQ
jgi:hypothetical protein